jgi:Fe-S-cluster containining protein
LILEVDQVDLAREPRLQAVTMPFANGWPGFDDDEDEDEYERLGPLVPGFPYGGGIRKEGGACPLLGSDNRCVIYATRPGCCVAFQAGSNQCQDARRRDGLPPLSAKILKEETVK